jgi:phosphinothricin acetyltransferase
VAARLIRLADERDSGAIAALYRPFVEDSRVTFEEVAPSAEEIARRIAGDGRGLHPWLVAFDDRRLLGFANSSAFRSRSAYRWVAESGIYVDPAVQGRGTGKALLGALTELLTRQGYVAVVAGIALPNAPSIALHEHLGYVHGGTYHGTGHKLGEWVDVGHWQRDLAARTSPQPERRPYREVAAL